MFFNSKRTENVPEAYEERLRKLEAKYLKLDAELMDLAQAQDIIRNKVLRKIQERRKTEDEETDPVTGLPFSKEINSSPFPKL